MRGASSCASPSSVHLLGAAQLEGLDGVLRGGGAARGPRSPAGTPWRPAARAAAAARSAPSSALARVSEIEHLAGACQVKLLDAVPVRAAGIHHASAGVDLPSEVTQPVARARVPKGRERLPSQAIGISSVEL